jgi:hypothetical protein
MSIVNDLRLIPNFLKVDNSGSAVFSGSLIITNGITGSISATNSLISSSIQLTSSFDTRYVLSGSITQTTWDNIASKPGGIISSSAQLPSGIISGSSQLPAGLVSGSSQLPSGLISGSSQLPSGIVSGSTQVDITATTNYTTFSSSINTTLNSLTESKVTHIVSASAGLYYIDGISNPSMIFVPGITYRFDTTIVGVTHPFKFSTTANGPTQYTTGVTSGSNFIQIEVGYNTTEVLYYYCTVHSGMGNTINISKQSTNTTSNVQLNSLGIGMAASATAGRIDASGDIVAYSTSDKNFKENITPITNAIDKIRKISGNTYDWKEENKDIHGFEGNDVGVIAQEIEAVLPQLVTTRETGYKAVKYDKLVALLIEGIKEQQINIDNLTIEVENLKKQKGL